METETTQKDSIFDHPKRILVGGAVLGIGGFVVYKIVKKMIDESKKKSTERRADDSAEVRQAMAFRSAMNPSGISWMKSFDTTNVKAVLDTAKQVKKLDDVIAAYSDLYKDDLMIDLQNELSASDYQKILTLMSSNPQKSGGTAPEKFATKSQLIVAKKAVNLRSSPDATNNLLSKLKVKSNVIRLSKVGEFIGYATGKQAFDEKNNVKFIEVGYLIKKDGLPASLKSQAGKKFTFWVSSSSDFVDIFPYYKNMWEKYPSTQNETAYKKPLDFYDGVSGLIQKPVVTVRSTQVLDEGLRNPLPVRSATLLGDYIMTLNTGKGSYVKFRTLDNSLRWVKADDAAIRG